VTITPSPGTAFSVPVSLTVQSVHAAMTVNPAAVSFSYQLGATNTPATQSVSVFSNPSGVTFAASVSSTGNWLSVGTGESTPGSTSVSVNVAGLAAGTY